MCAPLLPYSHKTSPCLLGWFSFYMFFGFLFSFVLIVSIYFLVSIRPRVGHSCNVERCNSGWFFILLRVSTSLKYE